MLIVSFASILILNLSQAQAAIVACPPLGSIIANVTSSSTPQTLDAWATKRASDAQTRIENKFAATSTKIAGATEAAPVDPKGEYQYLWIRDNAIVETEVQKRRDIVANYIEFCKSNLSTKTLGGLGEPKFNPDGTAFNLPWGRPQNDSSAYRALRWMDEVDYQLGLGKTDIAKTHYSPDLNNFSLKWDLEYIARNWNSPSFDLWEEEQGINTHTLDIIHSALERGATLAKRFEPLGAKSPAYLKYTAEAANINKYLTSNAWDAENSYLRSTMVHQGGFVDKQQPLDMGTIIGVLHSAAANPKGNLVFKISDDRVMATMAKAEKTFSDLYQVNQRFQDPKYLGAAALGRYAEDIFHGGNPWMITTQTGAEYYYRLGNELASQKSFTITATNLALYARLGDPTIAALPVGTVVKQSSAMQKKIVTAIKNKGDAYLELIRELTPADGIPSEQIGRGYKPGDQGPWVSNYLDMTSSVGGADVARAGGEPLGAFDLTWNDASFLSLLRARNLLASHLTQ